MEHNVHGKFLVQDIVCKCVDCYEHVNSMGAFDIMTSKICLSFFWGFLSNLAL